MAVHKYQRKDGSTVYCASYFGPDGKRKVERVRTVKPDAPKREHERAEAKARAQAADQRAAVANKEWKPPKKTQEPRQLTFRRMVEKFLSEYRSKSGDMTFWKQRAAVWLAYFKDRPAPGITVQDVLLFRRWREETPVGSRKKPVGPTTVRKDLVGLSTLFRWARVRGLVRENPADSDLVKRPQEPKNRTEYLTLEQEKKLLENAAPWLARVIRWATNTGMDRGEIPGLSWRDVDEAAGVVHAPRGKTGVTRTIPLNKTLRSILAECKKGRTLDPKQPVFLDGELLPIRVNQIKMAMPHVYKRAGFTVEAPFKIFRHTFASRLASAGFPAKVIAELMGHAEASVTERYMHLAPGILRDAMAVLDNPKKVNMRLHKENSTKKAPAADSASS